MPTIEAEPRAIPRLRIERISTLEEAAETADEWNALAGDVPFRRWEWLGTWWRHYRRQGDELCVVCVRDDEDRLFGLAPWYVHRSPLWGRVLRFLGSGVVCSDHLTILAAGQSQAQVSRRIADWTARESGRLWDAVELDGLAADDAAVDGFLAGLAERGLAAYRTAGLSCWRVALPGSWEEYVGRLSKTRRERVRQLHRRAFQTGRAVVNRVRSPAELDRGYDVLVDLHQRRRRSLGEPGCFSSPRFRAFLHEAAERFLAAGRLRLQWIELEGRPVAAQIDLAGGETVYHYQSGIDPDVPRERPGWLGTSAALKGAVEGGFAAFDFLRGDEAYKSHWRAEPVATFDVRVAASTPSARVRQRLWIRARKLRSCAKRRLPGLVAYCRRPFFRNGE